jgi:hypothetical protein
MSAGKGSAPRNLGPKFKENWDQIFAQRRRGAEEKASKLSRELRVERREPAGRTVSPHP